MLDERIYHPQHPAGWGKHIAFNSTYPADVAMGGFCYASSLTEVPCSGGPGDVGYLEQLDVFLDALIQQGVNKKGDGIIRLPEAEAIFHLDVRGYNMQD